MFVINNLFDVKLFDQVEVGEDWENEVVIVVF